MMVKPSVNELLEKADNRYELVIATSKRARQLAEGKEALTDKKEESVVTLAADEIAEGKVKILSEEEIEKLEAEKEAEKEENVEGREEEQEVEKIEEDEEKTEENK